MNRYIVPAIVAFVVALIVFQPHPQDPAGVSSGSTKSNQITDPTSESTKPLSDSIGPARTKSKIRAIHHKPTIEETSELLKNTIIPVVDLPEQPLPDQVAAINQLIQKAGVAPYELRLIHNKSDPSAKWKTGELRVRKIPIAVVLKYLCDSTRLRCQVRENGIVELTTQIDDLVIQPESKEPDGEFDPFAELSSTKESKPVGPAGEDDPFAKP